MLTRATTVILFSAISACSSGTRIGDHVFEVPSEHRVEANFFWLPKPEPDSLMFTINPGARLQDQHSVLVQPKSRHCREPTTAMAPVCRVSFPWDGHPIPQQLEKHAPALDGGTQWQYLASDPSNGQKSVVTSCFGPAGEKRGLCQTAVPYGDDLFLSIGHSDDDVPKLNDIVVQAKKLLRQWER